MLVVHKHKKNINLSRDMNYGSFSYALIMGLKDQKWPNPKIKGLV